MEEDRKTIANIPKPIKEFELAINPNWKSYSQSIGMSFIDAAAKAAEIDIIMERERLFNQNQNYFLGNRNYEQSLWKVSESRSHESQINCPHCNFKIKSIIHCDYHSREETLIQQLNKTIIDLSYEIDELKKQIDTSFSAKKEILNYSKLPNSKKLLFKKRKS